MPVILLDERTLEGVVAAHARAVGGRGAAAVDTNLNILHDGLGHVFVEVSIKFGGCERSVTINAGRHLDFFRRMAKSSMLALGSRDGSRVFAVQLPKPASVERALDTIERNLMT